MGDNDAGARIIYTKRQNERGYEGDCVIAVCEEGEGRTEPVWGHGDRSVKRALATLSKVCSCGARWHEAVGRMEDDEVDENDPFDEEDSFDEDEPHDPYVDQSGPPF